MAGKFKKGDVVFLKSGGPAMTITGEGKTNDYAVVWFDANEETQYREFDEETLEDESEFEEDEDDEDEIEEDEDE